MTRHAVAQGLRVALVLALGPVLFPPVCWGQPDVAARVPPAIAPPDWAYPVSAPNPPAAPISSAATRVPGSEITFLPQQLTDLYSAPDWHPGDHPVMPAVVAHGGKPGVYACAYCHLPDGAGRPENASLAGLPAAYIVGQVRDFSSGARRSAVPTRLPPKLMTELAAVASDTEIKAAAEYFSRLKPQSRVTVIETDAVPHVHVVGWIFAIDKGAPPEPIGHRIIEVPEDAEQFEHRDARAHFIAYVPIGAVEAGRVLVTAGGTNQTLPCAGCHGPDLQGTAVIPGIAGRSPSYIMRQLFDIQSGARAGAGVAPMTDVVRHLGVGEMIDISSYIATLH